MQTDPTENEFLIRHYQGLWDIRDCASGNSVIAKQIVIDSPATARAEGIFCTGQLRTESLVSLSLTSASSEKVRIVQAVERAKRLENLELSTHWCLVRDQEGSWKIFRSDNPDVSVLAKNVELDCKINSYDGVLICKGAMYINNRCNLDHSFPEQKTVQIRSPFISNQTVVVGKMSMFGTARIT